jgi:AraC family transcriptional regulator, positive regulator of tynA and feaB
VEKISGTRGAGVMLYGMSQSLYEEADRLQEEEGAAALDAYFQILLACIGRMESERRSPQLELRIQKFMDDHLSEPGLAPAEIAAAADISVRHLHRLFSNSGSTLGACIRAKRLAHCRSDLTNPRLRGKTITEIAFSWGFSDSAHFSRSFRQQFGICPRVFRAQASLKGWNYEKNLGARDLLRTELGEPRYSRPN